MDTYLENECFFSVVFERTKVCIVSLYIWTLSECFFAVVFGNRSMRELKVALYHYIDGHLPRE